MDTLVIYDNEGFIIDINQGQPAPREPIGVPFIWVDIPEGKRIKITDGIGVDVSVTPHQVILEDKPPTEVDILRLEAAQSNSELVQLIMMMGGGL